MSIEERHEALVQSVEMLASMQRATEETLNSFMAEMKKIIPPLFDEHDLFRDELRLLMRSQVLAHENSEIRIRRIEQSLHETSESLHEATDKLNGLIGAVDLMRSEFDARLRRLESNGR
jgi:hypothetical protein